MHTLKTLLADLATVCANTLQIGDQQTTKHTTPRDKYKSTLTIENFRLTQPGQNHAATNEARPARCLGTRTSEHRSAGGARQRSVARSLQAPLCDSLLRAGNEAAGQPPA